MSRCQMATQLLYNGRRLIGGMAVGECVDDGATLRATAGLLGGKPVKVSHVPLVSGTTVSGTSCRTMQQPYWLPALPGHIAHRHQRPTAVS
jgi:hypothetical protein